jgi:uncharacterized protein (TIGR02301 family)
VALCLAGPAAAAPPPRSPDQRQTLLDLAYVLGEAHALRAACQGPEDQAWRSRMSRMMEVEQPEPAFRRRLIDNFNTGFASRQAETPTCGPDTPAKERAVAVRGRALAQRLAVP